MGKYVKTGRTPPNPILPEAARVTRAGPPGRWEVVIDGWRPAALNELLKSHWAAKRLKALDRDHVILFAGRARVPMARGKRRVSLRIVLPPKQRRWDVDAPWKSLLDACVRARLLVDDSPRWCQVGTVEYVRGEALSTTIIVEDVDGDGEGS